MIPTGFLESLMRMYNFLVLQDVKESHYYYNEKRISGDIQNYLFAVNFEPDAIATCTYTGEKLEITEDYLERIEKRFLGKTVEKDPRLAFRKDTQKEYTAKTLTQEILAEGKPINETNIYLSLQERYVYNLKENVLDPFLGNKNFRRAIKDLNTAI